MLRFFFCQNGIFGQKFDFRIVCYIVVKMTRQVLVQFLVSLNCKVYFHISIIVRSQFSLRRFCSIMLVFQVPFEMCLLSELRSAVAATIWLFTSVYHVVSLQISCIPKYFATKVTRMGNPTAERRLPLAL